MMKSLLLEKWGTCDLVCDQYLEGIERVAIPTDPKDKAGMLSYVKNAYNRLTTLTRLEVTRGQPVPGLEDYYLSNQFLKRVHRVLPEELGSQFLMKLQENGESYYLMKGRQYMDRMISLLRCCYKSLEIALEDYPPQQSTSAAATAKPRPAQLPGGKTGSMSVNMFSVGMCPASCAEPSTVPAPHPLGKRRRRRKKRRRSGVFVGIEERVTKLEQELKQIRLQVACQERRIAELEAEVTCSKGQNRKAKSPAQRLPFNTDGAGPACQTVAKGSAANLASGTGKSELGFPDQGGQTLVPQSGRVGKRRKSKRKKRKSGSTQEPDPDCLGPCSLPTNRTVGESRRFVLKPESAPLAIQMNGASVPPTAGDQGAAEHASVGVAARIMKYTGLYVQKTPLNRAPCVAGLDPMALLQFMFVIEIWKTRLIPVLIWILQHLKN